MPCAPAANFDPADPSVPACADSFASTSTSASMARFERFHAVLAQSGLLPAITELAGLMQRRCAGVFVLHNERSLALACHDRQGPAQGHVNDQGLAGRVHCFVKDAQAGLLKAVPAHGQPELPASVSVPIITAEGGLLGTLSCFDLEPQLRPAVDLELMLQVAAELARDGAVQRALNVLHGRFAASAGPESQHTPT